MFKTIALLTAVALTTTACAHGPQQTYKNYAKKVNAERKELGLKNWQWSPTEVKVMGPVVVAAAGLILIGPIPLSGKGAKCAVSGIVTAGFAAANPGVVAADVGKTYCITSGA